MSQMAVPPLGGESHGRGRAFLASTALGRVQVFGGQVEGRRAEAVVVRARGRMCRRNCWLNHALLPIPAETPLFLSFSSSSRRVSACQGRCQRCRVPPWVWDVLGMSTPCLMQVAGGWGAMAIEDLNLSALLMTSAGISMGEFLFS